MSSSLPELYKNALNGLRDSISFHRCLVLVVRSEKIRLRVFQCLVLNGVIFLGSIAFFNFFLSPILYKCLELFVVKDASLEMIHKWIEWIYFGLWIAPVYLLSFILNALWYQDIASEAIELYPMKRPPTLSSTLTGDIAELIHRSIFNICFLVYLVFIRRWKIVYLVSLAWMIAYNSFEYKWVHFKVSFQTKISTLESSWVYFTFFGLPLALIAFQFPSLIENGLISVAFPFLLMMASTAGRQSSSSQRIRILIIPDLMARACIFIIHLFNRSSV
jgi:etoposide-induced 2.4 mRNA